MDPQTERAGGGAGGGALGAPGSSSGDDGSVGSTDTPSRGGGAAVATPPGRGSGDDAALNAALNAALSERTQLALFCALNDAALRGIGPYSATQDGARAEADALLWLKPVGDALLEVVGSANRSGCPDGGGMWRGFNAARALARETLPNFEQGRVDQSLARLARRVALALGAHEALTRASRELAWVRFPPATGGARSTPARTLARGDPDWRDWAGGVPPDVLVKIAEKHIAQTEAGQAVMLQGFSAEDIQYEMAQWKRNGNCLFVFASVCEDWREAQLKVGGPLCTRVVPDVLLPGSVALAMWALAEGCPREAENGATMATVAAWYGHTELVQWLIQEQGFAMDGAVMANAARSGNLELVRWLRGEGCDWGAWTCSGAAGCGRLGILQWLRANGCPWDAETCYDAVVEGHVEVLRWARENGCPWYAEDRDRAAADLGYTDDLGNLVGVGLGCRSMGIMM